MLMWIQTFYYNSLWDMVPQSRDGRPVRCLQALLLCVSVIWTCYANTEGVPIVKPLIKNVLKRGSNIHLSHLCRTVKTKYDIIYIRYTLSLSFSVSDIIWKVTLSLFSFIWHLRNIQPNFGIVFQGHVHVHHMTWYCHYFTNIIPV